MQAIRSRIITSQLKPFTRRGSIQVSFSTNYRSLTCSVKSLINASVFKSDVFNRSNLYGDLIRMGSSSSKSFSPSKAAAAANIVETPRKAKSESISMPTTAPLEEEYVEGTLCHEKDLNDNEMKSFELGEGRVLVVKQNGKINAIGAKCTHYGAPLTGGVLSDGRIRCQWHGACFKISNGDIEDYPGLDSLPCYQVTIEDDGGIKVRAKKSELRTGKRAKTLTRRDESVKTTFVCVGGGASGAACVEVLRQEGFNGRIVLVCKENYLPYDRVLCTKQMDADMKKFTLRTLSFYADASIDVMLNTEAIAMDPEAKTLKLSNGDTLAYDKVYFATGSTPREPALPGADLKNVCVVRTLDDAKYILSQLNVSTEVVILGASFIGLETAAFLVGKVAKITIVARDSVPLKHVLGEEIGTRVKELFVEKGVVFVGNSGIKEFNGKKKVESVTLSDDTKLKADLCIVGIGSTFNTKFLKDVSNLTINDDGTVPVNEFMQTSIENVYAGGDIANAPVFASKDNVNASIGHYSLAHYHGRIAAMNMLEKNVPLKAVPFFWTQFFGKSIRYAGHGQFDRVVIDGNLCDFKFIAYFLNGDDVVAMASCQRDPIVAKFAELLAEGKRLTKADVDGKYFK